MILIFILNLKFVIYVLKILSWFIEFLKFELVNPYLVIFIGLIIQILET
jgi:hypothetical protein